MTLKLRNKVLKFALNQKQQIGAEGMVWELITCVFLEDLSSGLSTYARRLQSPETSAPGHLTLSFDHHEHCIQV